ncbi:MAG TPA: phosphoribosylamine--glycine ligase [Vicinamibacterales bacterium]|nr:phosphoribosylamine--glycine ligase [Vicinamibacterales bacterium]
MKVLVLGSGAREHALVWRLQQDPEVTAVTAAPGNPGMAAGRLRTAPVNLDNPQEMLELARSEVVDLTVVGPEAPLAAGVADLFQTEQHPIVGPTAAAARLETSKAFAKAFMERHGIPTARFSVATSPDEALAAVRDNALGWPLVLKADGLAGGKGVVIALDPAAAESAVRDAMVDRRFGDAGGTVVFEECLRGPEVSVFALSDGADVRVLLSAQDHKRAFDNDEGPNTGGMGAFAPSPLFTPELETRVLRDIIEPVITGMRAEGHPYAGFLYAGLMLTADGPKVIEFNARFGDPEAQVVLPALAGPFARVLMAAAMRQLGQAPRLDWNGEIFAGVVLASGGYPGAFESGLPIEGLDTEQGDALVFHAGTALENGRVVTAGGRVLTVVGRGPTYRAAIDRAYAAASRITFDKMHFRRDIGRSAL